MCACVCMISFQPRADKNATKPKRKLIVHCIVLQIVHYLCTGLFTNCALTRCPLAAQEVISLEACRGAAATPHRPHS